MQDKLPNEFTLAHLDAAVEAAKNLQPDIRLELLQLRDLLRWLAPRIERRNGNGAVSDSMCILCVLGQPQYKRQPCRHSEIFELGRGV